MAAVALPLGLFGPATPLALAEEPLLAIGCSQLSDAIHCTLGHTSIFESLYRHLDNVFLGFIFGLSDRAEVSRDRFLVSFHEFHGSRRA